MNWYAIKQYQSGRAPSRNVLKHQLGPCGPARNVINPLETFSLFVIDDMLNIIVDYTIANIEFFGLKFLEVTEQSDKYKYCEASDLI